MVDGQSFDIRQQRTSSGTRPTKQGKLRSGTVVDIPETMKVLPGPMGSERNSNFILIAQYVARAIAARWAMPEFMFTSDASNANYASTLVAESPFVKAREADQRFYGQAFVELLWKVLRLAHEIGRAFQNIEKFDDLQQILELTATGPRVSNRDELQTVQRQQIEVSMGTLSLETAAAEMGRDLAKEQAKGAHPAGQASTGSTQASGPTPPAASPLMESKAADQAEFSNTVRRRFRTLERRISLFEFDHNHDRKGRFAHGPSGGSIGGTGRRKPLLNSSGGDKKPTKAKSGGGGTGEQKRKTRHEAPSARPSAHAVVVPPHSQRPTVAQNKKATRSTGSRASKKPIKSDGNGVSSHHADGTSTAASQHANGPARPKHLIPYGVIPEIPTGRAKPPHARNIKKFVKEKKGAVEFVPEGTRYTSKEGASVLYRNDQHPDFKSAGAVVHEVQIEGMIGDHRLDYRKAKTELRKKGVSEERIAELFDPSKYRPHHVEDQMTIQFVHAHIHDLFTHRGSASDIKVGRPPVIY